MLSVTGKKKKKRKKKRKKKKVTIERRITINVSNLCNYVPFISLCFENKAILANPASLEFLSTSFNWNAIIGRF